MSGQTEYVLPYDKTVVSTGGHTIKFLADTPTPVPNNRALIAAVIAAGGVAYDPGKGLNAPELRRRAAMAEVGGAEATAEDLADTPEAKLDERRATEKKMVFQAFEQLIESGDRNGFAPGGVPKPQAVERLTSLTLPGKLVNALWVEFQKQRAGE